MVERFQPAGTSIEKTNLPESIGEDKFLMPFEAVSVPLKFQREGIKYKDLSEEDKEGWDAPEWDGEDGVPDSVDPAAVNKWLFNIDTVDKILAHLMTRGIKVAGERRRRR